MCGSLGHQRLLTTYLYLREESFIAFKSKFRLTERITVDGEDTTIDRATLSTFEFSRSGAFRQKRSRTTVTVPAVDRGNRGLTIDCVT